MYRSGKDVWPFYCCDPGWSVFNNVSRDTFLRKQHIWDDNNNNNIHTYILPCVMVYYIVSVLFLLFFWSPCVAINVSVQYNGGLLPGIILLTQCYFHRGTRLNAM